MLVMGSEWMNEWFGGKLKFLKAIVCFPRKLDNQKIWYGDNEVGMDCWPQNFTFQTLKKLDLQDYLIGIDLVKVIQFAKYLSGSLIQSML